MSYVVVTFGAESDDCPGGLNREPMHAHGPYETLAKAHAVLDRLPRWMSPHVLDLASDEDACLREH